MKVLACASVLLFLGLPHGASACLTKDTWITLSLTATARESSTPERVRITPDGCVSVDGPDAGLRTLQLTSNEVAALQNQVASLPRNAFDVAYIRAQVSNRVAVTGSDPAGVLNGDIHDLTVRAAGVSQTISWYGLYFDQARFPDVPELSGLATLSRAVRAYSFDSRLVGSP